MSKNTAKTRAGNIINTIHEIITTGRDRGILHLYSEDSEYNGREITFNGKKVINYGSCSYLGLELDERLKLAAIEGIKRYGIQYSSSRTYASFGMYKELEESMEKVFGSPVVLSPTTTLGHQSVIPVVIEEGDIIILDQQVHASIQYAANNMQLKGNKVVVVRHNNMDELESKIHEFSTTGNRIWYMIDGIYSMYGIGAPIEKLKELMEKYPQLYLYVDDAHGMSWKGKNGRGYTLGENNIHPKMIMGTSFAKAFGTGGGAFVFHDRALAQKVKNCGGPLIFSGPAQIPVIAASVASAKIHLSKDIYELQQNLEKRIAYCHSLMEHYGLPVVSTPGSAIKFIGLGLVRVGYNMIKRMMEDGCYTNLAVFPAVPEACTGLRFTITNHHSLEDIEYIVERLAHNLPKALADEGRNFTDIQRSFRKVKTFEEGRFEKLISQPIQKKILEEEFTVTYEKTIRNIPEEEWNNVLGHDATYDWEGMCFLEDTFTGNELPEHNWGFHYYIIRNREGKIIIATYFTEVLTKDDMLAPANISKQIEIDRQNEPYLLCSTNLMMGTVMSIGKHIYIDRNDSSWKKAMMLLLDKVWKLQDELKTNAIFLRDFDSTDEEIKTFLMDQGFIKVDMPDTHIIDSPTWKDENEFLSQFSTKRRYNLKQEIFKQKDMFDIEVHQLNERLDFEHLYSLYLNVADKSYEIADFPLPMKLFKNMMRYKNWEIIELKLKDNGKANENKKTVAVCFCYNNKNSYGFMIVGMDYQYIDSLNIYKQAIWQAISRGNEVGAKKINLGLTASMSKRKFGAKAIPQVSYIQMLDSYNASVIASFANTDTKNNSISLKINRDKPVSNLLIS